MTDDFGREERAFTEALRDAAETESFLPIDPAAITRAAQRRPAPWAPWAKGVAAAAALVIALGGLALVIPRTSSGSAASAGGVQAEPTAAGGAASAGTEDQAARAPVPSAAASAASGSVGEWRATSASPLSPRTGAVGAWLDGSYYMVGGHPRSDCAKGELCPLPSSLRDGAAYDPVADTWTRIADAPVGLAATAAVAVAGRLYVLVSDDAGTFLSYDPATDTWTTLASAEPGGRLVGAADTVVEVASRRSSPGTSVDRVYDPASDSWSPLPADPLGVSERREAVWTAGRLVLAAAAKGDTSAASHAGLAELDLGTMTWQELPSRELASGMTAVGELVVWPSTGAGGAIYDPASGVMTTVPALPGGSAGGLFRGVVTGGRVGIGTWLLDPVGRTWVALPRLPLADTTDSIVVGSPDGMLVFGGWVGGKLTAGASYLPVG